MVSIVVSLPINLHYYNMTISKNLYYTTIGPSCKSLSREALQTCLFMSSSSKRLFRYKLRSLPLRLAKSECVRGIPSFHT